MSSIRFMTPIPVNEGCGSSVGPGAVDPYNQLPHPIEMLKKLFKSHPHWARPLRSHTSDRPHAPRHDIPLRQLVNR
jgi:hypothetical protein